MANNSRNLAYKAEQELRQGMYASSTQESPKGQNTAHPPTPNSTMFASSSSVNGSNLGPMTDGKESALDPSLNDTNQHYLASDAMVSSSLPDPINLSGSMGLSNSIHEYQNDVQNHQNQQLEEIHTASEIQVEAQDLSEFLLQKPLQLPSSTSTSIQIEEQLNHDLDHNVTKDSEKQDVFEMPIISFTSSKAETPLERSSVHSSIKSTTTTNLTQDSDQSTFPHQKDANFLQTSPMMQSASSFLPTFDNDNTF